MEDIDKIWFHFLIRYFWCVASCKFNVIDWGSGSMSEISNIFPFLKKNDYSWQNADEKFLISQTPIETSLTRSCDFVFWLILRSGAMQKNFLSQKLIIHLIKSCKNIHEKDYKSWLCSLRMMLNIEWTCGEAFEALKRISGNEKIGRLKVSGKKMNNFIHVEKILFHIFPHFSIIQPQHSIQLFWMFYCPVDWGKITQFSVEDTSTLLFPKMRNIFPIFPEIFVSFHRNTPKVHYQCYMMT